MSSISIKERDKILIVDDTLANIEILHRILQGDYDLFFAKNGHDCLRIAQRELPDLILLDIMMPEMDGYEAMRAVRKMAKYKKLPMIALTAKAMKGDREKCVEAGASDYITKPVDTEQLLSLLRVWLYQSGG